MNRLIKHIVWLIAFWIFVNSVMEWFPKHIDNVIKTTIAKPTSASKEPIKKQKDETWEFEKRPSTPPPFIKLP